MAKTTITAKKVTLQTSALKRGAAQDPKVRKELASQFKDKIAPKMLRVIDIHYRAALEAAAQVAKQGMEGGESGLGNAVAPTRFGPVSLGPWAALSDNYLVRKIKAYGHARFWLLTGQVGALLDRVANSLGSTKVTAVKVTPSAGGKSDSSMYVTSTLTPPGVKNRTLEALTREAFVAALRPGPKRYDSAIGSATSAVTDALGIPRKNLSTEGIVAVADRRRPLVSKLAEVLGAKAQAALRKISQ